MPEESDRLGRTDREMLIELRRDVRYIKEAMQKDNLDIRNNSRDHESRIRVLENFRWWFLGGIVASGGLGSLITRVLR